MSKKTDVVIEVIYSCIVCGLRDIAVKVKARGDEDVLGWMVYMGRELGKDHSGRSPHCHPKTLSELKIPIGHADRVGGPSIQ